MVSIVMNQPCSVCLAFVLLLGAVAVSGQEVSPAAGKTETPFDMPLVTMADIKAREVEAGKRVRIRAVLVKQRDSRVYLVSENGRDAQVNTLRAPWPALREGDAVELAAMVSGTYILPTR